MAETPSGYASVPEDEQKKAQAFFSRGKTVADTGNYDYAIEMYLQGLNIDPDSVEAHQGLREIAMKRKATGGKPLGMFEGMKLRRPTKDEKLNMLNAEKLLSYDPGNMDHMVGMLQTALKGGYYDTVMWMGNILIRANADAAKPEYNKFIILKDVYKELKRYREAVQACRLAEQMRPDDMDLKNEAKNLSAYLTMREGNYDGAKTFRDSVRDFAGQEKLMRQDADVQTLSFLEKQIIEARQQYEAEPLIPGKVNRYVDALVKTEQMEHENAAIEVLEKAFQATQQYSFRKRIGEVNLRQWNRMVRTKYAEVKATPNDKALIKEFNQLRQQQLEVELEAYAEWADHYPTDLTLRFEQAKRLYLLKRYDQAIPVLQRASADPKLKHDARIMLGRAFYDSGFFNEADDTLQEVINEYQGGSDEKISEMNYWRGRSLEEMGELDGAIKHFSNIARVNFNYLDVQQRIKKLREMVKPK